MVQTTANRLGRPVGNLFSPKGKLADLRHKIKSIVRATPTGATLASLIDMLNPIITAWRNYYRYASRACREFVKLDWWLWQSIGRWLKKKHPKASQHTLQRRFMSRAVKNRLRWSDGQSHLRFFWEGGTPRFPFRGVCIPNGWNADPKTWFLPGAPQFWTTFNTFASL